MGINQFASRRSYKALTASGSAGALTVADGEPVQVCGFIVKNETAETTWTVYDGDDTVLFTLEHLLATDSYEYSIPWMADNGLKIGNDQGDGTVVVFHNSPGN